MSNKMEIKKPEIGDIKVSDKGVKMVLINTESMRCTAELTGVKHDVKLMNLVIPQLKKIGLADTIGEICMNCNLDTAGLAINLGTKYVKQGRIEDTELAQELAKRQIEKVFANDEWEPANVNRQHLIVGEYNKYIKYDGDKLEFVNEDVFTQEFGIWATGDAADNFIKFKEGVEAINITIGRRLPTGGDILAYVVKGDKGLELLDNTYQEDMFKSLSVED